MRLLAALFDRCKACEEVRDTVERQIDALKERIWKQNQIVTGAQKAITQNMMDLDGSKAECDRFRLEHPELTEEIDKRYAEAVQISADRTFTLKRFLEVSHFRPRPSQPFGM